MALAVAMPPQNSSASLTQRGLARAVGEYVFRTSQQVEQVWRQTKDSQRSAAESFAKSADSHDRTAKSYEKLAELRVGGEYEYRKHAARHRYFAQEDRQIAERLPRMAGH